MLVLFPFRAQTWPRVTPRSCGPHLGHMPIKVLLFLKTEKGVTAGTNFHGVQHNMLYPLQRTEAVKIVAVVKDLGTNSETEAETSALTTLRAEKSTTNLVLEVGRCMMTLQWERNT